MEKAILLLIGVAAGCYVIRWLWRESKGEECECGTCPSRSQCNKKQNSC